MRIRRTGWPWNVPIVHLKRTASKRTLFLMLLFLCFTIPLLLCLVQLSGSKSHTPSQNDFQNYFLDLAKTNDWKLLLNSTNCQIPHFDPGDSSTYPFYKIEKPREVCSQTNYNWSSIHNNELILYSENMQKDGYTFYPGFCCYRTITRIQQSENAYDKNADSSVRISSECFSLEKVRTTISVEFIVVECASAIRKVARFTVTYRAFHGSAITGAPGKDKVREKAAFWAKEDQKLKSQNQEIVRPPNVLIIGLDSTSRLNFRRFMPKTLSVLERIGAFEMMGYTKVGENTFPNFIPIMTGYSTEDIEDICYSTSKPYVKQDDCPLVWKRFETANYLTGHVEDSPVYAIFHFQKTGFVKQPVDFYSRPLFLAASEFDGFLNLESTDHIDCLGQHTNDEVILSYLESIMDVGHMNKTPVFASSWSTTVSHDSNTGIQLLDQPYQEFLLRLIDKGYLQNTVMFFMGDHGYRFGKLRETLMGFYEDKLPNMWIYVGPKVKERFPMWEKALQTNARRLSSPFNLYWTFNQILEASNMLPLPKDEFKTGTHEVIPRKYHYSFISEIPETVSCKDMGVPSSYCSCNPLHPVNLNDTLMQQAAHLAVTNINSKILASSPCQPLTVSRIITGAAKIDTEDEMKRLIVTFVSIPGDFVIEAEVDYSLKQKTFLSGASVQRANKINPHNTRCIKDALKELYCFCPD